MIFTFKDLKTNKTVKQHYNFKNQDIDFDTQLFWWSEGNGSCDCNRAYELGIHYEMVKEYGDYCFGEKRIIAIDVEGDLNGHTKEEILQRVNQYYKVNI